MAGRAIAAVGAVLVGGGAYYFATSSPASAEKASPLTQEQKKSAMLRSRLSGHHPAVSGGDQCLSRSGQTGVSLKHLDSGKTTKSSDLHVPGVDKRTVAGGTVVVK